MRIIHTSDWHLGQYFYGKSRASEHKKFLAWLLEQIELKQVDAVIVAGDVFDTTNPPSYARTLYFDFIASIQRLDCQLIVLAGNHDSVAMLSESKHLLHSLNTDVVSYITEHDEQLIEVTNHQQTLLGVVCATPFIRPRDVLQSKAGQSASEKIQDLQQAIATHYQQLFEQAQLRAAPHNVPVVGTGHLTTVGASTSDSVREIYIGTLDAFPADAFPTFDYLALGHIHQSQVIGKSERIRYCGSPIALSFDEANQQKYVHLVDVSTSDCHVERLEVPCFQPLLAVKKSIDDLTQYIETFIASIELNENEFIWLDIEVSSQDYHHDIQAKIEHHLADYPVEVLRVRRAKAERLAMLAKQEKVTLEELDVQDVFSQRLSLANENNVIESDDVKDQEIRLTTLYRQMVEQVQVEK